MSEKAVRSCTTNNDLLPILQNRREVSEKAVRNCTPKNDLQAIVQKRREVSQKAVRIAPQRMTYSLLCRTEER